MSNKAVFAMVVTSFLIAVLTFNLYSIPDVFARKVTKGPIECYGNPNSGAHSSDLSCCQNTVDSSGLEIKYCTDCVNGPTGITNCGPRYTVRVGPVNTTGVLDPLGPNAPTTNNNSGTQPGSIIKVHPGTFGPAGNTSNPNNNTAMKTAGVYSPTGFCTRIDRANCIPCDPGLPGGRDTCIPTTEWPAPSTFKNKVGVGVASPLGKAMNAPPTGNNTGTPPPPPTKQVGPGCGPGTDNSTCSSTSTLNPQSTHKGNNQGPSTSTSNGNSTGH